MSKPAVNRRCEPRNWKKLERHPLSAKYKDITGPAWTSFVANLADKGNQSKRKITIHEGKILDGWQLYRACKELNFRVKPEFQLVPKGVTPEDFVETVNDHRRHETQEVAHQRVEERRVRVLEARAAGKSTRVIADEEGIDQKTVRNDLETAGEDPSSPDQETNGHTPTEPSRVTGRDGRSYPATRPEREAGDDSEEMDAEEAKAREAPKPGSITFDMKIFQTPFGQMIRSIDHLGRPYAKNNTPPAEGLRRMLMEFKEAFMKWKKELEKTRRS